MDATVSNLITQEATRQDVPVSLALAVANHESGGDPKAYNAATGDVGIFQLNMASWPGVDWWDPATNIRTGVGFLRSNLTEFGGDTRKALAAYNWGPSRVEQVVAQYGPDWYSHIPGQVQGYVSAVLAGGGIIGSIVGSAAALFSGAPLDLTQAVPAVATAGVEAGIAVPQISWLLLAGIALGAYWLFSD